jgi:hypothetical protein
MAPLVTYLFLLASLLSVVTSTTVYSLKNSYTASNWASGFQFFNEPDPTNGYVTYLAQADAAKAGLYKTINGQVFMGVDNTTVNATPGRKSVRVTTAQAWTYGLFVWDLAHVPASTCSVWPALWTVGTNWPNNGEIDGKDMLLSADRLCVQSNIC